MIDYDAVNTAPFFRDQICKFTWENIAKVWEFPKTPFVEYEPSDEAWCRPLKIGKEVEHKTTMTIPRVIMKFQVGGGFTIEAIPSYEEVLF